MADFLFCTSLEQYLDCNIKIERSLIQHAYSTVEKQSNEINYIDTLFDLLNFKEKSALTQLTTGLLNLYMNAYNKIN